MTKKNRLKALLKDQSGEFGVKSIAMTVAIIVIIGFIVVVVQGNMDSWVGQVWDLFMQQIQKLIS